MVKRDNGVLTVLLVEILKYVLSNTLPATKDHVIGVNESLVVLTTFETYAP